MKIRLFTIICIFIASTASMFAGEPTIKFESNKHDFGNIKEANGPVTATFTFTAGGKACGKWCSYPFYVFFYSVVL